MAEAALKEKAMDYFSTLDDTRAQMVLTYMETMDYPVKKQPRSLADLKGKIQFSDGYDYKAMRSSQ